MGPLSDMKETPEKDDTNNLALQALVKASGLTQDEARILVNKGQARPIALSTWKAYSTDKEKERFRKCPDGVLALAQKRLGKLCDSKNTR